jgi:hypothetical protein
VPVMAPKQTIRLGTRLAREALPSEPDLDQPPISPEASHRRDTAAEVTA